MTRILLLMMAVVLPGCYPNCVDDFDCQDGHCRTDVSEGMCVECFAGEHCESGTCNPDNLCEPFIDSDGGVDDGD